MNLTGMAQRSSEGLMRAMQHWEGRRQAAGPGSTPAAFTIAISREVGALGTSVGRAVGRRLGWTVYDHELLELIAHEKHLRLSLLESVDERRTSWIEECMEAFAEIPAVSESAYLRYLTETMLSLAAYGECVIVGRGAAQVLPAASTLRVRLVAPVEERVARVARERGLSPAEAARHAAEAERDHVGFIRSHYLKDPTDPVHYDLVLNTGRLSAEDCAEVIATTLACLSVR